METENVIFLPFQRRSVAWKRPLMKNEISSVIIEGIQGLAVSMWRLNLLRKIRSLCDAHNAVFIADSVQCGYGAVTDSIARSCRCAGGYIYHGKGHGQCGFPVAGISIAPKIQPKHIYWAPPSAAIHLACAGALAFVLEVMERNY